VIEDGFFWLGERFGGGRKVITYIISEKEQRTMLESLREHGACQKDNLAHPTLKALLSASLKAQSLNRIRCQNPPAE